MFSVRDAADAGISGERMRRGDLARPFRGVRQLENHPTSAPNTDDDFAIQAARRRAQALAYAPLLKSDQFFSFETAAAFWEAPVPLVTDSFGNALDGAGLALHVSTLGSGPLARSAAVTAHRADARTSQFVIRDGVPISTAATTWASMGALSVPDLVALGDYFCRCWRSGFNRRNVGRAPHATVAELHAAIAAGRRVGNKRLREAVELIREDSWSPRESRVRCVLVTAGLPEPALNADIYDRFGAFLGCVDMVYPAERVIVEYHGTIHSQRYAQDVERIAALRAAGWTVIEVTAALLKRPSELVRRVRTALAVA